jgi:hypothetical protein
MLNWNIISMNETENTWRTLQEKQLLVKSRWCSFGIHKWTQYKRPSQRREGVYVIDYQTRYCDSCHLVDVKQLRKVIS